MTSSEQFNSVRFNQDASCFTIATSQGFYIYQCEPLQQRFARRYGAVSSAEMLFCSSLVVVVGSGQNPSLSARTLQLLNWQNDDLICEMSFLTAIVSVRLDSSRLVVILAGETQIFELKTASHLRTLDIANPLGICSITTNHEGGLFAHPSNASSSVRVFDVSTLSVVIDIPAHKTDIASISLSGDGSRIATASQKGTVVRVFQLPQGKQIATFRRGSRPATISSLSFTSPPNLLCCSSSSDTVHIFSLLHEGARQLFPDPWGSARGASALAVPVYGLARALLPSSVTEMLVTTRCDVFFKLVCGAQPIANTCAIQPTGERVTVVTHDGCFLCFCAPAAGARDTDGATGVLMGSVGSEGPATTPGTLAEVGPDSDAAADAVVWTKCEERRLLLTPQ